MSDAHGGAVARAVDQLPKPPGDPPRPGTTARDRINLFKKRYAQSDVRERLQRLVAAPVPAPVPVPASARQFPSEVTP